MTFMTVNWFTFLVNPISPHLKSEILKPTFFYWESNQSKYEVIASSVYVYIAWFFPHFYLNFQGVFVNQSNEHIYHLSVCVCVCTVITQSNRAAYFRLCVYLFKVNINIYYSEKLLKFNRFYLCADVLVLCSIARHRNCQWKCCVWFWAPNKRHSLSLCVVWVCSIDNNSLVFSVGNFVDRIIFDFG